MMFFNRKFAISLFIISIVFSKSSKQEKAENCVKGRQYWSKSFINPSGTCAACPPHWESCYDEPINDHKRCVDSCRVRPNPKTKPTEITPTTAHPSTPMPSSMTSGIPSKTVEYASLANLNEENENEKHPSSSNEVKMGPVIAIITVLSVVAFLALLVAGWLLVRSRRNRGVAGGGGSDPERDGVKLPCLPPNAAEEVFEQNGENRLEHNDGNESAIPQDTRPVQATPSISTLKVGGTQDTECEEDKEASSLSLLKQTHV